MTAPPTGHARPTFTCPACLASSAHPADVANGYCGRCHWYTGIPALAALRPDLFAPRSRTPQAADGDV